VAEAPLGTRFTFLDYVGLGFILVGGEEILRRPRDGWPIWIPGFVLGLAALAVRDRSPQLVARFIAWVRAPKKLAIALTENAELKKQLAEFTDTVGTAKTSKLVIHRATWGAAKGPGPRVDVTDKLVALVRDGLVVEINHQNPALGDPCPGKPKRLDVEYSYGSEVSHAHISRWEGNLSGLPEDTHAKWLQGELQKATLQRAIDVQNAKLRPYPQTVFTVEKVIPEGPATSPTVSLKNKVRIILTNHSDADVSVWTPVWESPDVHADGDPPGSTIQLAKREWQYDEWGDEQICTTINIGRSFRCYIALKPTIGESIYRRLETKTALGTLVFPVKIHGKLYDIRINI
jgi:hypothetical protein